MMKKIEEIIQISKGKKPKLISKVLEKGLMPYVDIKAFEQKIIDNYTDGEKCLPCEYGDLLIVCDGSRSGLVGRAVKGYVGSTLARIDIDKSVLPEYIYHFIQGKYIQLNTSIKGTGTPHLNQELLKSFELYVPSLEDQHRIVTRIEELFSQLDSGVETLKKTKEQLKVYRQAVLKEAFEGELTKQWRKENKLNNNWKKTDINDLIEKDKNALKAGPFGSSLKKECYTKNGFKIYGQEQVIAGDEEIGNYYISEEKYRELITCKVKPQDVLISLVGTVGKILVLSNNCKPGIINPRLIKVSLDKSKMMPMFFKYYFESSYLRALYKEKAHGATMDVLNKKMIQELPFPWCPISEQVQVIQEIESRLSVCDSIEKTIDTALQEAEALRQSILKQAFEGGL